ncbi:MAG: hypothetical protein U1E89_17485 [Burkholderiaceae bacterium]
MNARSSYFPLAVAIAGLAAASAVVGAEPSQAWRVAAAQGQARLSMAQAVTIAEVRMNATAREAEYKPDAGVYEIKLANADDRRIKVRIEAYGGRLTHGDMR